MGGEQAEPYSPQGECHPGYQGVLCAQCEAGYTRDARFQCAECPPVWQNVLLLTIVLVLGGGAVVLLVKATLAANRTGSSKFSPLFKVLANHMQLLVLVLSFELDWPPQVQELLGVLQPAADIAERVFSLDCFLSRGIGIEEGAVVPRVYAYLLLYLLLPVLLVLLSLLFWRIKAGLQQGGWAYVRSRATATVIVLFFLVHPAVTRQVFSIFHCQDIDGEARLVSDLGVACYVGSHLGWATLGGGLGLLLWVGGIPSASFVLLRDKRHQLGNSAVR